MRELARKKRNDSRKPEAISQARRARRLFRDRGKNSPACSSRCPARIVNKSRGMETGKNVIKRRERSVRRSNGRIWTRERKTKGGRGKERVIMVTRWEKLCVNTFQSQFVSVFHCRAARRCSGPLSSLARRLLPLTRCAPRNA